MEREGTGTRVGETRIPALLLNTLLAEVGQTMGRRSLIALLRRADLEVYVDYPPPADDTPSMTVAEWSTLVAEIYEVFGPKVTQMILWHAGTTAAAAFRGRSLAAQVGGTAMRLLPAERRLRLALERLAARGEALFGTAHQLREGPDAFYLVVTDCPHCAAIPPEQHLRRPVCHLVAAAVADTVEWATGEKHLVEEVSCIAQGDHECRFRVAR
jgi:hypothetical protein